MSMKWECVTEKIQYAVNQTYKVAGKNLTLPILESLYISAENNVVTITSTNLEVGIQIKIPARVHTPGSVAVSAQVFSGFISSLTNDHSITFEVVDTHLVCTTDGVVTKLHTQEAQEYPNIPQLSGNELCSVETSVLCEGFRSVVFAASTSSMRPELGSVYVSAHDDKNITFVATDSFRLAEKVVRSKKVHTFEPLLIPAKNITHIIRTLENIEGDTTVYLDNNQIAFSSGDVYITSRIIDGTFPDYKRIIPETFEAEARVLKEDLFHALKVTNVFSGSLKKVTIHILPQNKSVTVATQNETVGETENTISAQCEGDELTATFNGKYIQDSSSILVADSVTLHVNQGNKPMVMRSSTDPTFTYLVMPMNV